MAKSKSLQHRANFDKISMIARELETEIVVNEFTGRLLVINSFTPTEMVKELIQEFDHAYYSGEMSDSKSSGLVIG